MVKKPERALPDFADRLARLISLVCWIEDRSRGPQLVYYTGATLARACTAAGCPMSARYVALCLSGEMPSPSAVMVGALADAFDARTAVEVTPLVWFRAEEAHQTFERLEAERVRLADLLRAASTG